MRIALIIFPQPAPSYHVYHWTNIKGMLQKKKKLDKYTVLCSDA